MSDRVLVWHIPDSPYGLSLPRYYMDADYAKVGLRVYAEVAPVGDVSVDIRADGVSIFANDPQTRFSVLGQRTTTPTSTIILMKGENSEEDAEDFSAASLEAGAWVSCHPVNLAGARGVTISLELDRISDAGEVVE